MNAARPVGRSAATRGLIRAGVVIAAMWLSACGSHSGRTLAIWTPKCRNTETPDSPTVPAAGRPRIWPSALRRINVNIPQAVDDLEDECTFTQESIG
jgi:hypothetical protein